MINCMRCLFILSVVLTLSLFDIKAIAIEETDEDEIITFGLFWEKRDNYGGSGNYANYVYRCTTHTTKYMVLNSSSGTQYSSVAYQVACWGDRTTGIGAPDMTYSIHEVWPVGTPNRDLNRTLTFEYTEIEAIPAYLGLNAPVPLFTDAVPPYPGGTLSMQYQGYNSANNTWSQTNHNGYTLIDRAHSYGDGTWCQNAYN